jgi:plastocyanin
MPPANFPINIVRGQTPKGPSRFDPRNLTVRTGDVVFWNNKTRRTHEIWWKDPSGTWAPLPIGGPIPPNGQSDAWTVTNSFEYRCNRHAGETGKVTV